MAVFVGDVVDEHAPRSSMQTIRGAVPTIGPRRGAAVAHTGCLVMDIPSVSEAETNGENVEWAKKGLE